MQNVLHQMLHCMDRGRPEDCESFAQQFTEDAVVRVPLAKTRVFKVVKVRVVSHRVVRVPIAKVRVAIHKGQGGQGAPCQCQGGQGQSGHRQDGQGQGGQGAHFQGFKTHLEKIVLSYFTITKPDLLKPLLTVDKEGSVRTKRFVCKHVYKFIIQLYHGMEMLQL